MKTLKDPTGIRNEFTAGQEYKESISLFSTYEQNEDFYIGNQWRGVDADDLDKPVMNILRRVVSMQTAKVVSSDWGWQFTFFENSKENDAIAQMLSDQVDHVVERIGLKAKSRMAYRNECVDGDACVYFDFDADAPSGMNVPGMITAELVENINVYFGNKYDRDVQSQPWIILHQRRFLESVRDEARANGISETEVLSIAPDYDSHQMESGSSDQVSVLTKLWKEDGTVHAIRIVKDVVIREEWDTGLKRYPISWTSWELIKGSYHGQAMLTGLIPNQIALNKAWAGIIWQILKTGFSQPVIDGNRIKEWDGTPGTVIKTSGGVGSVRDAIMYLEAAPIPMSVINAMDSLIATTRDCMGASDATMGNVNPDNASAIIALQQADEQPLELRKLSYNDFVEDMILNILDLMRARYGKRKVMMLKPDDNEQMNTQQELTEFDFSTLDDMPMNLTVDIGASSLYSEQMQVQTISNMFSSGILDDPAKLALFLTAMPSKLIPSRQTFMTYAKSLLEQALNQQPEQPAETEFNPETPQPVPQVENTETAQP